MNDSIKNVVIGGAVALVVAFAVVSTMQPTEGPQGPAGRDGQTVGAVASPELYSDTWTVNGVKTYFYRIPMVRATTTLCAAKIAPEATTTITYASFKIDTGTSTAATIDMSTSTTAFATSTGFSIANSVASGAQGSSYWRPVGGTINDARVAPGEFFVVKTAGAGLSGYTYTGYCEVEAREL